MTRPPERTKFEGNGTLDSSALTWGPGVGRTPQDHSLFPTSAPLQTKGSGKPLLPPLRPGGTQASAAVSEVPGPSGSQAVARAPIALLESGVPISPPREWPGEKTTHRNALGGRAFPSARAASQPPAPHQGAVRGAARTARRPAGVQARGPPPQAPRGRTSVFPKPTPCPPSARTQPRLSPLGALFPHIRN